MHPARWNTRSMPWVGEEALVPIGEQDSTSHDIGPRTSKSSSPFEESNSMILRGYYGVKGSRDSNPFHIKPKAHAEEEEVSEDERRESRLPGYIAEDHPVLGKPKSQKGKAPRRQRQSLRVSQRRFWTQWASHRSMVEKNPQEKLSPSY